MQGHKQVKTFYSECTKILKMKYFMQGYESLNKDRKFFQIFMRGYENLNKDRNDLKKLYSETHENFKNQMFYVRLI